MATATYQTNMVAKQEKILENQVLIAKRAKMDGTVTKYIAVLTAFFLPGTFIAVSIV